MTLVTPPSGPDFDETNYQALIYYRREPGYVVHDSSGPFSPAPTLPAWATATTYKLGQEIRVANGAAVALSDHVSGATYAADLAAGKWKEVGSATSGAGLPLTFQAKTANYTAAAGEFVEADATSGGFTVTLPTAPAAGALVAVKKMDSSANVVTVSPAGGGTIDGDSTATIVSRYAGAVLEHVASNVWLVTSLMNSVGPAGTNGTNGVNGTISATGNNGSWYACTSIDADGNSNRTIAVGTATMGTPMIARKAFTINQLGCYIQTAGTAGALVRLGLYQPSGADPFDVTIASAYASLLVDGGTAVATGVGMASVTLGTPYVVTAGQALCVLVAVQGTGGSVGIYHENANTWKSPWGASTVLGGGQFGLTATGVSGALPATFTPSAFFTAAIGGAGWFHRSA